MNSKINKDKELYKENLKKAISKYMETNIKKHYEYVEKLAVSMDDINKKFIPVLLKEINKDLMKIIDKS